MPSVPLRSIGWEAAATICAASTRHALELGVKINVAVVDVGGNLLAFQRMNGAFLHSITIAQDKAYTALSFGLPTAQWRAMFDESPELRDGLVHRPRFVTLAGGQPIEEGGAIIGGVGVSGASEAQDEACAQAGLRAIDL